MIDHWLQKREPRRRLPEEGDEAAEGAEADGAVSGDPDKPKRQSRTRQPREARIDTADGEEVDGKPRERKTRQPRLELTGEQSQVSTWTVLRTDDRPPSSLPTFHSMLMTPRLQPSSPIFQSESNPPRSSEDFAGPEVVVLSALRRDSDSSRWRIRRSRRRQWRRSRVVWLGIARFLPRWRMK